MTIKKTSSRARQTKAGTAKATSRRPSVFPAHLNTTPEDWRRLKRTEWMEVRQALERYLYGSAYCPAGAALYHLGRLASQIDDALDGDWIAW